MDMSDKKAWKSPEITEFSVADVTEGTGGSSPEGFFNTAEDPSGS